MHLSEATWTDVRDADLDVALLPVGSTEQHGPHAPLGTDALTAEAVATAGAETYDGEAVVGPTIPVGIAEEHRHFDGTLWVSPDTFRAYVRETAASVAAHDVDCVVFVNGHGGNVEALAEVARRLSRDGAVYAVAFTWFDALDVEDMGHGGSAETSLIEHLHPDLIREDRIEAAREGAAEQWGEWISGVNVAHDAAEFSANGVVGDPGDASPDRGVQLLDDAATALAELMAAIVERDRAEPERRLPDGQ